MSGLQPRWGYGANLCCIFSRILGSKLLSQKMKNCINPGFMFELCNSNKNDANYRNNIYFRPILAVQFWSKIIKILGLNLVTRHFLKSFKQVLKLRSDQGHFRKARKFIRAKLTYFLAAKGRKIKLILILFSPLTAPKNNDTIF